MNQPSSWIDASVVVGHGCGLKWEE
ncbi:hypothetical protein Gotur_035434, partial [Gossypium turneri]